MPLENQHMSLTLSRM